MPIKNAIHSQQVYDPTDESIMAEQELCMDAFSLHFPVRQECASRPSGLNFP